MALSGIIPTKTFKGTGNVDTFIKRVNLLGTFSNIKKDMLVAPTVCTYPISAFANDPLISNGTINNYALNLIEAPCAWSVTVGETKESFKIEKENVK